MRMGLRERYTLAQQIVATYWPDPSLAPPGLLLTLTKAFGEAEQRGYAECLTFFQRTIGQANDNQPPASGETS